MITQELDFVYTTSDRKRFADKISAEVHEEYIEKEKERQIDEMMIYSLLD